MQVAFTSHGSPDVFDNEDFVAATASVVVVLDGASVPLREGAGCIHGTPWFVRRLATALVDIFERELKKPFTDNLAQAIVNVNALHIKECDLTHAETPSAAVAILREYRETIEVLLLGRTTLVLDEASGIRVLTGANLKKGTATGTAMLVEERDQSNAENGRFSDQTIRRHPDDSIGVSTDPSAANLALISTIQRQGLRRAALLSDGAARLVTLFKAMDWPSFLDQLDESGPAALIERLRAVERSDPDGLRWPRASVHDDATAVLCHFRTISNLALSNRLSRLCGEIGAPVTMGVSHPGMSYCCRRHPAPSGA